MLNISKLISEYNTPQGIVKILDNMDIITLNHSVRVCEISKIVEKELFKDKKLSLEEKIVRPEVLSDASSGRLYVVAAIVMDNGYSKITKDISGALILGDSHCKGFDPHKKVFGSYSPSVRCAMPRGVQIRAAAKRPADSSNGVGGGRYSRLYLYQ